MMRTIHRDIVSAVMVSRDEKILLGMQQGGGSIYPNCWLIPGGGIDAGETVEAALIREVREETGLDISGYPSELLDDTLIDTREKTLRDTGERVLCTMRYFRFRVMIPQDSEHIAVTPGDDLVECRWMSHADLATFPIPEVSQTLFRTLGYLR